jgi:hypothetical protein
MEGACAPKYQQYCPHPHGVSTQEQNNIDNEPPTKLLKMGKIMEDGRRRAQNKS